MENQVYSGWCFCMVFLVIVMNGKKWVRCLLIIYGCMLIFQVMVVWWWLVLMDLMMLLIYCVKFWLVIIFLIFGWWGICLVDGWWWWWFVRGWWGFVGLLLKVGIWGCKMLNNVWNVSVLIVNGCSVFL